jgi:toxin ParE1/3/4
MGLILRTPLSKRDYVAIWDYIARENPDAADSLLREFDAKLNFLSENPKAGSSRPEIRPRIRSYPVGSYVLFYRPLPDGVELIRVLHGARDVNSILKQSRDGEGYD